MAISRIERGMSPLKFKRLETVVAILSDESGEARISEVVEALFLGSSIETANKGVKRLREALDLASEELGVSLALCVTEAKSGGAENRRLWFEGVAPPPAMNQADVLERVGDSLIEDTQGVPLGRVEPRVSLTEVRDEKPLVRLFLSYAHADMAAAKKLRKKLEVLLKTSNKYSFELWVDDAILVGEVWRATILEALDQTHLGLMLLSPGFLASEFIKKTEIPAFVLGRAKGAEGKRVIPVELKHLDFDTMDLRGLEARQIYRGPPPSKGNSRDLWLNGLLAKIVAVVDRYGDVEPDPDPRSGSYGVSADPDSNSEGGFPVRDGGKGRARALLQIRSAVMLSSGLDQIADGCLLEDTVGRSTTLESSALKDGAKGGEGASVDAVEYILNWLRAEGEDEPELFALLGEYGMGKTITCQRVVRAVEAQNGGLGDNSESGESEAGESRLPTPLYFDLRKLSELRGRGRVPTLVEVMDECIQRGWSLLEDKPSAQELLERATREPTLFVFDGLDEALVHLDESSESEFTSQLLRVRECSRSGGHKTRVLISCRTHFFRSLKEQDSHFVGQDRGRHRASDYRALVLLPLNDAQIKTYLANALPDFDAERALGLVRSVHNLGELAQRPYTLSLISDEVPRLEELRAEGKPVFGVTLYRFMVERWLNRDRGKHHIKPDHKRGLMRYLAAETWARGSRLVPASELEAWFGRWLESDPVLSRRYRDVGMDKLEEDLRTATFLVREDGDEDPKRSSGFRFAHSSMQEYFLACYLFEALERDEAVRWRFGDVSMETWGFFVELVRERGGGDLWARMSAWVRGEHPAARALVLRFVVAGQGRDWPKPSLAGGDFSGVKLQGAVLRGPLDLSNTRWAGANLRQVDWEGVTLDRADFEGADLFDVTWNECSAKGCSFGGAQVNGGVFRKVDWAGASWEGVEGAWPRGGRFVFTRPAGSAEEGVIGEGTVLSLAGREAERGRQLRLTKREFGAGEEPAWSPDGERALVACADASVRLWDVATGECIAVWTGHKKVVNFCAFSPDGTRALSASSDSTLRLWDVASGECIGAWMGHNLPVFSCAFSPDGARALSASVDGTLRLWDVASGECLGVWTGHKGSVTSCAFSPDGTRALSAGEDSTLCLWDVASGECLGVWTGHEDPVTSCAFSPDGMRALSAGIDNTIRSWDVATGECIVIETGHKDSVISFSFSPDGVRAISAGEDSTMRLWDVDSGECIAVWVGRRFPVTSCAFSPNGTRVLSVSLDSTLSLWDVANGECIATWTGHTLPVASCGFSPVASSVLSAGYDGTVRLWSTSSGACLGIWIGHKGPVLFCAFSPNGTRVLSAGFDSTLRLWDVGNGECIAVWTGHKGLVSSCAFSPVAPCALSVGYDSTIRLWDVSSGECLGVWTGHKGPVLFCAFSPDGTRVLSAGSDSTMRLWDVATGESVAVWTGHKGPVSSCAFSPDGARTLSASHDNSLRLWDVATGECVGVWTGHKGLVSSCAFSPDGARALSASTDNTMRLWDVATGECLAVWTGHEDSVLSCAFSPDGARALSASTDKTLRLWDVANGKLERTVTLLPDSHIVHSPDGHIIEASDGAWRWLRWQVRDTEGKPLMLPLEAFGPLPRAKVQAEHS